MKSLIAYYSRRGENYVGGDIVNLPVGNTEVAAGILQKLTGGDTFRIDTVKAYPGDYHATTEVAQQELRENARPELVSHCADLRDYQPWHVVRADLLRRMGRTSEALEGYHLALRLTQNRAERRFLERRLEALATR